MNRIQRLVLLAACALMLSGCGMPLGVPIMPSAMGPYRGYTTEADSDPDTLPEATEESATGV